MPRPSGLSFDLLLTFLRVLDRGGDAMAAARELDINQPSMSKRLAQLQHAGRGLPKPWLVREGKTWKLTEEGRRVEEAVRDIVRRYDRLTDFVAESAASPAAFTFACGRQAATGFVLAAARRFRAERPDTPFRITHLRGRQRIEGVANGALDLAAVTDRPEEITNVAHRELHSDDLPEDPLVLVAVREMPEGQPAPPWLRAFLKLPKRSVSAAALAGLPLIVPEPNADVRALDEALRAAGASDVAVTLEVGGWPTILEYTRAGLGVGLVTVPSLAASGGDLEVRALDRETFPPVRVRLICRKRSSAPGDLDLTEPAARFRTLLLEEGKRR